MQFELLDFRVGSSHYGKLKEIWDSVGGVIQSTVYDPPLVNHLPNADKIRFVLFLGNGIPIGGAALKIDQKLRVARINNFAVTPPMAGRGLGRTFFTMIDQYIRPQYADKLTLLATLESFGFWQKMGFETIDGSFEFEQFFTL